jgi:capsular exopolysaccharide synthesis family protein
MPKQNTKDPNPILKKYPNVLLDDARTQTRFAEAYRTLRTNIHFLVMERKLRSMIITSAGQSEGKTVTVFNLGYTIAQTGRSVLIVDADLRKPMLTRLAGKQNPNASSPNEGLTGILSQVFSTPISTGSLTDMSIQDIMFLLKLQERTGALLVNDGTEEIELMLKNGDPVSISWNTRPDQKKLANLLVKNAILSKDNAQIALQRRRDTGQKLGFILINMGLVTPENLKGPLTIHASEALHVFLQMRTGNFRFAEKTGSDFEGSDYDPLDLANLFKQMRGRDEVYTFLEKALNRVIVSTDVPNLNLLPSGVIPPNPSELMGSDQMELLLEMLKRRFDVLMIDTPPLLPASDALLVAPKTDGVLMVVKAGGLRRKLINKAVEQIRMSQANILGVVLNQVDVKREGYYKYYNKYYSGYYSEQKK